jgi:hypothetical protein
MTRRYVLWPLIIMAIGAVWLLRVADAFPPAVDDILIRAWPALLILFGLDVLFGRRRLHLWRWRIETGFIGLVLTLLLVIGVVWFAYQKQADVVRADNIKAFSEVLTEGVDRVRLDINTERTSITINPAENNPRYLGVAFKGSDESRVEIVWTPEGDTGVLTVTEEYRNSIPKLEDYGRGTLEITLPTGVIVERLDLSGGQGDVTVNLAPVHMRQIRLITDTGDIQLHLPALDILQGELRTSDGAVELLVPPGMALDVKLASGSGSPRYRYDEDKYDVLRNGELKPSSATEFQYALDVWLNDGAALIITDLE